VNSRVGAAWEVTYTTIANCPAVIESVYGLVRWRTRDVSTIGKLLEDRKRRWSEWPLKRQPYTPRAPMQRNALMNFGTRGHDLPISRVRIDRASSTPHALHRILTATSVVLRSFSINEFPRREISTRTIENRSFPNARVLFAESNERTVSVRAFNIRL